MPHPTAVPPYHGTFTTPPIRLDWSVHQTTGPQKRPTAVKLLAPSRPFSASVTKPLNKMHLAMPHRPRTARSLPPPSGIVRISNGIDAAATLTSNAIAEAALRETHQIQQVDPLCGTSVEIRPMHVTMPRGNRTADFYRARGFHYRTKGDLDSAVREYESALRMAPRDFKALFNLGLVHDRMGDRVQALACYRRACKVDAKNAFLHFNMGICHLHEEEYEDAIACFTRAIELEGTRSLFFKNRAFAYRKARRYTDAAKDYTVMGKCQEMEGQSVELPDEDDHFDPEANQMEATTRACPLYQGTKGIAQSEQGMFYYDAAPLYTPRDSSIRATTTMERKDPRICYKITAAPPETRSDGDLRFLMDKCLVFPSCKAMSESVLRSFCTHVSGVRVTTSTVLFQENDVGAFVFFLLVGKVSVTKHNLVNPETADGTRPTVETWLRQFPLDKLHTESALLDEDFLRQQTPDQAEVSLYTLRPGSEFGNHGRFRRLPRGCTAVVEEDSQLLVVPWSIMFELERAEDEARCPDIMEFLGKLRLFWSVPQPQLRLMALKAKCICVSNGTVIQVPGQVHEGLLIVRRGKCKLVQPIAATLGSRHVRAEKKSQHHALHTYTALENDDSPIAFVHLNQTLTRQLRAVPLSHRPEIVAAQLVARDYVGVEAFLSNETNKRVLATHMLVADSESELLYLRKTDFFTDTSYTTRQRVRANIKLTAQE
ncbi:unnamed protein product [Aphanomyces euteiches]